MLPVTRFLRRLAPWEDKALLAVVLITVNAPSALLLTSFLLANCRSNVQFSIMLFYMLYMTWLVLGPASANVLPLDLPSISDPTITPAPQPPQMELFRKQVDNNLLGWTLYKGTWSSETCATGGTYYQSGSYARCCSTTAPSCNVVIGCVDGSMIYAPSTASTKTTIACSSIWTDLTDRSYTVCNTAFYFENMQDSNPHLNIFCGVDPVNWTFYRSKPPDITSTTPSRTYSTPSSSATPTPTPTSTPTSSTTAAPIQSTTPKKPSSKAWIAGVVIGPLAAIAIAGLVAWIVILKRKNKKQAATPGPPPIPYQSFPPELKTQPPRESYIPYNPQMQHHYSVGAAPYSTDASQHQRASYMSNSNGQGASPTTPSQSLMQQQGQTSPYGPPSNSPQPGQGFQQQQHAQQPQQQWQPINQPSSPQMMPSQYPQDPIVVSAGGVYNAPSPRPAEQVYTVPPQQQSLR
ncbi:hypothetical protein BCR34DRAFT_370682 [Clohesyomyces aquaticus]|uniref:Uncharacterized protein n=1 Tax=Clohesyomyces aquaticus TaxID=1231657 RepID=A0A1Y1ZH07_9PLEO|nr:hypothetical protein BCR34DRAFT_370682 [Clohesyomyces aquaticus]